MKKKVLATLIITALCCSFCVVGVFAGSNLEQIQAYLNRSITFSVNNADWAPKDDEGATLAPIIYNGHTYLPVRSVGQALGVDVVWDDANQKVKLTRTVTEAAYGTPYKDVNPQTSKKGNYQTNQNERQYENNDDEHDENDNKNRKQKQH